MGVEHQYNGYKSDIGEGMGEGRKEEGGGRREREHYSQESSGVSPPSLTPESWPQGRGYVKR